MIPSTSAPAGSERQCQRENEDLEWSLGYVHKHAWSIQAPQVNYSRAASGQFRVLSSEC
jgi:hypothetical protein